MAEEEALLGHDGLDRLDHKYRKGKSGPFFRSTISFLATSLACGVGFSLILFTIVVGVPSFKASAHGYLLGPEQKPAVTTETALNTVTETYSPPPPVPTLNSHGLLEKNLTDLRAMVDATNGYYARDWSLGLGWNNMRYIIEASLLQAQLLNRTLILPSHIYARSCEYGVKVCEKHAKMINKNDITHTDKWRNLPIDQQMSWYIPLEVMIDIPRLRAKHPLILMTEYLLLQGLDPARESQEGWWDRTYYQSGIEQPDFYFIPNKAYEPDGMVRVDTIAHLHLNPRDMVDDLDEPEEGVDVLDETNATNSTDTTTDLTTSTSPTESESPVDSINLMTPEWLEIVDAKLARLCEEERKLVLDWSETRIVLTDVMTVTNDTLVELAIDKAGWMIVHTFEGNLGMDFTKTTIKPLRQVTKKTRVRGFVEDFQHIRAKILLIEGEVHLNRKPGFLRFTTDEGRDRLARIALQDIHSTERVTNLAHKMIKRMDDLNEGRSWMSAHMRRGDFVTENWAMSQTLEGHYNRIMSRLHPGRTVLARLSTLDPQTYNVPDVQPNTELWQKKPPKEGDFIYFATDERDPEGLKFLRDHSIKLFEDLVTEEDRREFGWPLLYSDVIALVEQNIIGQGAGYFYAHALSSVAGGILNIRAATGADPRTSLLD